MVALARGGRTLAEIDTALNLEGFTNTRGKRWPARTDGTVLTRILSAAGVAAGAVADAPAEEAAVMEADFPLGAEAAGAPSDAETEVDEEPPMAAPPPPTTTTR